MNVHLAHFIGALMGAALLGNVQAQADAAQPAGVSVLHDIAYGAAPQQTLDVYRPQDAPAKPGAPIIVMVHGGAWVTGDKASANVVTHKVEHWVAKGYVLVSINYRLLPVARPLEQADDVAQALAYIQSHAAEWGADAARLVLMGHSAGAHLVLLVAASPRIAERAGARPWRATVALDNAAFDLTTLMAERHPGFFDQAFGADPAYWRQASPLLQLNGQLAAPLLAVCSSQRRDPCAQAWDFADRAAGLGGASVTVLPVDLSHGQTNTLLGTPSAYTALVQAYIESLGLP